MKIKLKTKNIIKNIALALAGVAAITAVGFGVKTIVDYTKDDLKQISLNYEVGNLGTDGKFVDNESTLYTKEAFGCYGLQIKPDFDSTVNYQIFYYDILDNYISSTSSLSDGFSGEAPVNGAYARIVIEPRNDEVGKISWAEKIKYPSQLTVKVNKNQNINDRFDVFKGKVMQVVSDIESLVFTNGLSFNEETFSWVDNERNSVTSTTVLKVTGGSTINVDLSSLRETHSKAVFKVYQFSGLPLNDNISKDCFFTHVLESKSIVLDKSTKYIILAFNTMEANVGFSATEALRMPSFISVTK